MVIDIIYKVSMIPSLVLHFVAVLQRLTDLIPVLNLLNTPENLRPIKPEYRRLAILPIIAPATM